MHHDPLTPLLQPVTALRGVGPAVAALIGKAAGGPLVRDLLFHMPDSYLDRRERPTIRSVRAGQTATLAVEVLRHEKPQTPRQPWRVVVSDGTGTAELVFFSPQQLRRAPIGARLLVSGRVELYGGRVSLPHPDHLVPQDRPDELPAIEPVWPLTAGLFPRVLWRAMREALGRIPDLPEWHDAALLKREEWPGFAAALRAVQAPEATAPAEPCRLRLAYDELLADQVAIAWMRNRERKRPGRSLAGDGTLRARALAAFGHTPTRAQVEALAEIDADLASPRRMLRLLQGDVGSGKTLVAALAMLRAVEAGAQAALMAPTEVLARQHHRTLAAICPVSVALLTGAVKGAARREILAGLASGRVPLVVGTHALFQEAVAYRDLGLAVIDEQHRFGVDQRVTMGAKGEQTDVLVMTATPIPRTLLLTQWGEMEVSRLGAKPAGRAPIRTTLHSLATLPELVDGLRRALDGGSQIYWVCPMVAESEASDLAAAEERYASLRRIFGARVGLAHGQQDPAVRDVALAAFAGGQTQLLVATTVIEVGVDVPEASVMVIEHAERFGLAQLHQLRGRVGRGAAQSFCLLLHEDGVTEAARRRLTLLRDTEDGFVIADEDFRARGGGELLGTRQSGQPGFRLADPVRHEALLHMAHQDAAVLIERDPKLETPRGRAIRLLLRLFDRGAALRTLLSG
ncbi:MAG TPA: ATP-dependent DNA helicase RecG [Acetobacteraceae bacterium]|nr:ATP-dependent DNA helicase RecG [Acetobacteraceae bacterium]